MFSSSSLPPLPPPPRRRCRPGRPGCPSRPLPVFSRQGESFSVVSSPAAVFITRTCALVLKSKANKQTVLLSPPLPLGQGPILPRLICYESTRFSFSSLGIAEGAGYPMVHTSLNSFILRVLANKLAIPPSLGGDIAYHIACRFMLFRQK